MRTVKPNKKQKTKGFAPNHAFIRDAVEEYLKNGGKITRIERFDNEDFQSFISRYDPSDQV